MTESDFIDIDKEGQESLSHAQFFFAIAPLSNNQLKNPCIRYRRDGRPFASMYPSERAKIFKSELMNSLIEQKGDKRSKAFCWKRKGKEFSMHVILRKGAKETEKVDSDNTHKAIQDCFVRMGMVCDDRHCQDSRQIYANFDKANIDPRFLFAVAIRWIVTNEQGE